MSEMPKQEAKHTPGPWEVRERNTGRGIHYQIVRNSGTYGGSARYALAQCFQYPVGASRKNNQARANAHLIAAAPELIEVLNEFLQLRDWVIKAGGTEGPLPQDVINKFAEMQYAVTERARALIAKAVDV